MGIRGAILVLCACSRDTAPPAPTPTTTETTRGVAPVAPVAPVVLPAPSSYPHRLQSRHCALSGQRPSAAPPLAVEPVDVFGGVKEYPVVGVLVQKSPVVIEQASKTVYDRFTTISNIATPLTGVEVGEIVRASTVSVLLPEGELAHKTVLTKIERATDERDRPSLVIEDWKYAAGALAVFDDGTVQFNDDRAFQLTDAEMVDLMKGFAAAGFDALPGTHSHSSQRSITLACQRFHSVAATSASAALLQMFDRLRERVHGQTVVRLRYTSRTKVTWIDWPLKEVPLADLANEPNRLIPDALYKQLPLDHVLYHGEFPTTLVRDAGKVYVVETNQRDPQPIRALLIRAVECSPTATFPFCRLVPDLDLAKAPPEGVTIDEARVAAFGVKLREDLPKTDVLGAVLQGDYLYRGLAIARDASGRVRD